jgi:Peptidase A4 family
MQNTNASFPYRAAALALVAGLLVGAAGGVAYERRDQLGQLWQPLAHQALPAASQPATAGQTTAPQPASHETTAIQQLIQRANDEQAQAIANRDPSVMADTSTGDHYREMQQINQDLLDHDVTAIKLTKLEWGPVTVNGSTALATTYETWTTTYSDGTSETTRDTNQYSLVQDNGAWKIASDQHPDQTGSAADASPGNPQPSQPRAPGQGVSNNWSGYAATGGAFTSVTGTWTVPQVSSDGGYGAAATWVGIGGMRSRDLIQAGTEDTASGSGRTTYQAWIETLPQASRRVRLAVSPGDSVTVAIAEQSQGMWKVSFKNNTTGQTYDETVQYNSSHSSAEWVEEAPSAGRGQLPLDNFGTVTFSGASAVKDGQTVNLAQAGARPITMRGSGGRTLASPSGLSADGSSFSVSRTR